MKEIIFKQPKDTREIADVKCQKCGGELKFDTIPCPDSMTECLVCHCGWVCQNCFSVFQ